MTHRLQPGTLAVRIVAVPALSRAVTLRFHHISKTANGNSITARTLCSSPGEDTTAAVQLQRCASYAQANKEAGTTARQKIEWTPSQAHRESATTVHRRELARMRAGAGAAGVTSGAPQESIGASGTEIEAAPANAEVGHTEAGLKGARESSVAASSATSRFRERRELERLAAAGDAEAKKALSASTASATSAHSEETTSGSSSAGESSGDGDKNEKGFKANGTVLSAVLILAGVGYYFSSVHRDRSKSSLKLPPMVLDNKTLEWLGVTQEKFDAERERSSREQFKEMRSQQLRQHRGGDKTGREQARAGWPKRNERRENGEMVTPLRVNLDPILDRSSYSVRRHSDDDRAAADGRVTDDAPPGRFRWFWRLIGLGEGGGAKEGGRGGDGGNAGKVSSSTGVAFSGSKAQQRSIKKDNASKEAEGGARQQTTPLWLQKQCPPSQTRSP